MPKLIALCEHEIGKLQTFHLMRLGGLGHAWAKLYSARLRTIVTEFHTLKNKCTDDHQAQVLLAAWLRKLRRQERYFLNDTDPLSQARQAAYNDAANAIFYVLDEML